MGFLTQIKAAKAYRLQQKGQKDEALKLTETAMIRLSEPGLRQDDAVQEMKNELQYRWHRLKRKLKEQ